MPAMTGLRRLLAAVLIALFAIHAMAAEDRRRQLTFYEAAVQREDARRALSEFAEHVLDRLRLDRSDLEVRVFSPPFPGPSFRKAVAVRNRSIALVESVATPQDDRFRIRNRVYLGSLRGELQFEPIVVELLFSPATYGQTQDLFTAVAQYAMAVDEYRTLVSQRQPLMPANTQAIRERLTAGRFAVTTAERRERRNGAKADMDLLRYLEDLRRAIDRLIVSLPV